VQSLLNAGLLPPLLLLCHRGKRLIRKEVRVVIGGAAMCDADRAVPVAPRRVAVSCAGDVDTEQCAGQPRKRRGGELTHPRAQRWRGTGHGAECNMLVREWGGVAPRLTGITPSSMRPA
jgi:hypothetical protein